MNLQYKHNLKILLFQFLLWCSYAKNSYYMHFVYKQVIKYIIKPLFSHAIFEQNRKKGFYKAENRLTNNMFKVLI